MDSKKVYEKKNRTYCCVPGCESNSQINPKLSFHNVPKAGSRRIVVDNINGYLVMKDVHEIWVERLKLERPLPPGIKVCSIHFNKKDFRGSDIRFAAIYKRNILNREAIPSRRLPTDIDSITTFRRRRRNKSTTKEDVNNCPEPNTVATSSSSHGPHDSMHIEENQATDVDVEVDVVANEEDDLLKIVKEEKYDVDSETYGDSETYDVDDPQCVEEDQKEDEAGAATDEPHHSPQTEEDKKYTEEEIMTAQTLVVFSQQCFLEEAAKLMKN